MGVQVLAIAVWLGSVALYGAAFFFPEVHRRHDFFWSGVGAFYGLVLWFSAVQTSPTELLGHLASVVLLGWLGWQTLTLRRKRTPLDLQTPLTADSWPAFGRQLKQSTLSLLNSTPLGRWLPETEAGRRPGDPAIATSEIRVSSLKDVDYEFVDELEPVSHRSAPTAGQAPKPVVAESAQAPSSPPVRAKRSPRPPAPQPTLAPPLATQQKPSTFGARLAGLKAWVGDVVKAKTAPKPKRAVIEIPPRPSPLAKNKAQPAAKTDTLAKERASLDQPPGITIIDTEATESFDEPEPSDRDEAAAAEDQSSSVEETITEAPTGSPSRGAEVWADTEDTNWADDEN